MGLVIKNRMCDVTKFKVKYRGHQTLWRNNVRRQKLQNIHIFALIRAKGSKKWWEFKVRLKFQ